MPPERPALRVDYRAQMRVVVVQQVCADRVENAAPSRSSFPPGQTPDAVFAGSATAHASPFDRRHARHQLRNPIKFSNDRLASCRKACGNASQCDAATNWPRRSPACMRQILRQSNSCRAGYVRCCVGATLREHQVAASSRILWAPTSAFGTAANRACVYGCFGRSQICSASPISTTSPRYITATRLQKYRMTPRS